MKKSVANRVAEQCYRAAITRGKYETCTRDYTAVYYPEDDNVIVTYVPENSKTEEPKWHVCKVRKSWASF
jgi:hypothetical protein